MDNSDRVNEMESSTTVNMHVGAVDSHQFVDASVDTLA